MTNKLVALALLLGLAIAGCDGGGGGGSQTPGDLSCTGNDCAPESPRAQRCGGIDGAACPQGQECVDDPGDDCDPAVGADCGGLCQPVSAPAECRVDGDCVAARQCFTCPGAPEICPEPRCDDGRCVSPVLDCPQPPPGDDCREDSDCVADLRCYVCADGIELCPTAACADGHCVIAVPDCPLPPPTGCGGFGGTACPDGFTCVDDPSDECAAGPAADCAGICVPKTGEVCRADSDCPALRVPCPICPDGSSACTESHCVDGQCLIESRPCPSGPPCDGIAGLPCPPGLVCVDRPDDCDPATGADCGGVCVPDFRPQRCGGFIGDDTCPDGEECVDDPSDMCDPNAGGADCPGVCQRAVPPSCTSNEECPQIRIPCSVCADGSEVCPSSGCLNGQCEISFPACPPPMECGAGVGCRPGFSCVSEPGCDVADATCAHKCVPDDQPRRCGGFAGETCPPGYRCADDPMDECDPAAGGQDCGGVCQIDQDVECRSEADCPHILAPCTLCPDGQYACPHAACDNGRCNVGIDRCGEPSFCGGIAGFPCPPGFSCIDDPRDDCSPENGGADCGGMCVPDVMPPPPQCASDADCAMVLAPCRPCPDGSDACPVSFCSEGQCRVDIRRCAEPELES